MDILKNICMTFDGERDCKKKRVFVSQVTDGRTDGEISREREAALAWMKEQIGDFVVSNSDEAGLEKLHQWCLINAFGTFVHREVMRRSDYALFIGDFEGGETPRFIWFALHCDTPCRFYLTRSGRGCESFEIGKETRILYIEEKVKHLDIILPPAEIGGLRFNETKVSAVFDLKEDGWYHSRDILFLSARNVKDDNSRDILTEYLESKAFRKSIAMAEVQSCGFPCSDIIKSKTADSIAADIEISLPEKNEGIKKYNGADVGVCYWLKPAENDRSFGWVNTTADRGQGVCRADITNGVAPMFRIKEAT
jgi:hypothetical protein